MSITNAVGTRLDKVRGHLLMALANRSGQTLVEYALLLILIAVVVVMLLKGLGSTTNNMYSRVNSALPT